MHMQGRNAAVSLSSHTQDKTQVKKADQSDVQDAMLFTVWPQADVEPGLDKDWRLNASTSSAEVKEREGSCE
jgi:hypothetical protein